MTPIKFIIFTYAVIVASILLKWLFGTPPKSPQQTIIHHTNTLHHENEIQN